MRPAATFDRRPGDNCDHRHMRVMRARIDHVGRSSVAGRRALSTPLATFCYGSDPDAADRTASAWSARSEGERIRGLTRRTATRFRENRVGFTVRILASLLRWRACLTGIADPGAAIPIGLQNRRANSDSTVAHPFVDDRQCAERHRDE